MNYTSDNSLAANLASLDSQLLENFFFINPLGNQEEKTL